MDQALYSVNAMRKNEDIALDLLKFITETTGIARPGVAATGFVATSMPRPEEQVTLLLDLYTRCLRTLEGK